MEEKNKYFNEGEVPFEQQDIPKGEEKELVKCLDMNQEGNLVVRTKDNIIKEIMSGEVSIRGVKGYV